MSEKKVYILLTDTGTLFTRLIKLCTKKPYNHASIAFDSELSEVYSFGRKTARNPFIGGFVKEDVKRGLFKRADCAIYSIKVTEIDLQKMQSYLTEIEAQKKYYRYNFLGLFGVLFNKPLRRKKAFFCSQFVASILNECSSVDFEKPLSLIAPNDLQSIGSLQFEYEGKLTSYQTNNVEKSGTTNFPTLLSFTCYAVKK
ncbi:hypothetical protein [Bacillus sp. REN16]|uniref:hypothetical protein n=1 Tax=Bacillus sp. REN16 TaxID=2887296 RepID=UPI001E61501D|nr:hypothetical protein [Bacillus sp. REN16]MCC3357851.1 hypothetical protein [Bacillus sp. REN16]